MTNEEKAKIICDCDHCYDCLKYSKGSYFFDYTCKAYTNVVNAMNWKDEQFKELLETELRRWNGESCEIEKSKFMEKAHDFFSLHEPDEWVQPLGGVGHFFNKEKFFNDFIKAIEE